MTEALDLTDLKTMNTPGNREAWDPRGAAYAGRENLAVFRSVVGLLLWLRLERPDILSLLGEPLLKVLTALKSKVRLLPSTTSLLMR